ncbi:MAG: hypothetical protein ACRC8Y_18155 [Chroococcales cyanobacterium]
MTRIIQDENPFGVVVTKFPGVIGPYEFPGITSTTQKKNRDRIFCDRGNI